MATETAAQRVHVERVDAEFPKIQGEFDRVVANLLKDAPNTIAQNGDTCTRFDDKLPTNQRVSFDFRTNNRSARVTASYHVDHGSSPNYDLTIVTPVIIDGMERDEFTDIHHPFDPHEIVTFRSRPFYKGLNVEARVVTKLGDFGRIVEVAEYTAGGLLHPVETLGRGKLRTIEAVTALFRGVSPQNPVYLQPLPRL